MKTLNNKIIKENNVMVLTRDDIQETGIVHFPIQPAGCVFGCDDIQTIY